MRIRVRGWVTPDGYVGEILSNEIPSRALKVELELDFDLDEGGGDQAERIRQVLRVLDAGNPETDFDARYRAGAMLRGDER